MPTWLAIALPSYQPMRTVMFSVRVSCYRIMPTIELERNVVWFEFVQTICLLPCQ